MTYIVQIHKGDVTWIDDLHTNNAIEAEERFKELVRNQGQLARVTVIFITVHGVKNELYHG